MPCACQKFANSTRRVQLIYDGCCGGIDCLSSYRSLSSSDPSAGGGRCSTEYMYPLSRPRSWGWGRSYPTMTPPGLIYQLSKIAIFTLVDFLNLSSSANLLSSALTGRPCNACPTLSVQRTSSRIKFLIAAQYVAIASDG
jgi:hypothetical protein